MTTSTTDDVSLTQNGHVATLMFRRPPHNFLDESLLRSIADLLERLDRDPRCRAIVLASEGKSFCAGADFSGAAAGAVVDPRPIYAQAMRLFDCRKPIVAAVQGAAIGAGVGLALVADFRVACEEARFSVNFNRLGFHPGFGLSHTLPRLIGVQQAALLFYTGRRISGREGLEIRLVDELVRQCEVLDRARALAGELALGAPIAVQSTRETLRAGLVHAVREANARETLLQEQQFLTEDFQEGVRAMSQRRQPDFHGR